MLGEWAYLRNFIEITVTPPGGAAVRRSGYMLTILRKDRRPVAPDEGCQSGERVGVTQPACALCRPLSARLR